VVAPPCMTGHFPEELASLFSMCHSFAYVVNRNGDLLFE
jgi:hypothetical protein